MSSKRIAKKDLFYAHVMVNGDVILFYRESKKSGSWYEKKADFKIKINFSKWNDTPESSGITHISFSNKDNNLAKLLTSIEKINLYLKNTSPNSLKHGIEADTITITLNNGISFNVHEFFANDEHIFDNDIIICPYDRHRS